MWDVLQSCHREGSLDTAIRRDSEPANDLSTFFRKHRQIDTIFFNGQKAETAFRRHVLSRSWLSLKREFQFVAAAVDQPGPRGPIVCRETRRLEGRSVRNGCDGTNLIEQAPPPCRASAARSLRR